MVEEGFKRKTCLVEDIQLFTHWDDVICPICLDFPHNSVLLQCSSHDKGCLPFVCNTDHLHSNCLDRFREANLMSSGSQSPALSENPQIVDSGLDCKPPCPLCRGDVTGWVVVDRARVNLDVKKRCCEEEKCQFSGTYLELQKHAQVEHPHARPSKIDPARKLDWENFQQSSEIIDVLSTIHSEVPHGIILGDYVIEYGDNSGEDFDDFRGDEGNWWTSCIFYQVFKNFRNARNRRRSRVRDTRRGNRRRNYETSNSGGGSISSIEYADYNVHAVDDEFANVRGLRIQGSGQRSSRRRHFHIYDD